MDADKFGDDANKDKLVTAGGVTNFVNAQFNEYNNQINNAFDKVNHSITTVSKEANAGTAAAMAAAMLPQVQNTTKRNALGVSFGNYRGETAFAVGLSGMNRQRDVLYKASVTMDSTNSMGVSAGVGFAFGPGKPYADDVERTNDYNTRINRQEAMIEQLQSEKQVQEEKINSLTQNVETLSSENQELKKRIDELAQLIMNR